MRRPLFVIILLAGLLPGMALSQDQQSRPVPSAPGSAEPTWQRTVRLSDGQTFVTDGGLAIDAALAKPATLPADVLPSASGSFIERHMSSQSPDEVGLPQLVLGPDGQTYTTRTESPEPNLHRLSAAHFAICAGAPADTGRPRTRRHPAEGRTRSGSSCLSRGNLVGSAPCTLPARLTVSSDRNHPFPVGPSLPQRPKAQHRRMRARFGLEMEQLRAEGVTGQAAIARALNKRGVSTLRGSGALDAHDGGEGDRTSSDQILRPSQYPSVLSISCSRPPPASRLLIFAAISATSCATVGRRATCGITVTLGCGHNGLSGGNGSGCSASSAA